MAMGAYPDYREKGSFSANSRSQLARGPKLHHLGLVALVTGIFCIYFWLSGIHERLETIRTSHDRALAALDLREAEQRALKEELAQLQGSRDASEAEKAAQTAKLEEGMRGTGYANFKSGQLDGAEDIVVVVKTGATEADRKVPAHILTTFTHAPLNLIFSDHEQQVGTTLVHDALNETSDAMMQGNADFDVYRDQQKIMTLGQDPEFVKPQGAWDLDKYKNVPMLVKTYRRFPLAKWYLFLDADSYVLLANLLQYLATLDSTEDHYIGSAATIAGRLFAHGGTGYVISNGLVSRIMKADPDFALHQEHYAKENCCGDFALAEALREYDVEVNDLNPSFGGDPHYLAAFNDDRWCKPIYTMHHLNPDDVTTFWGFERKAAEPGKYILFRDVFEKFIYPAIEEERVGWNNMGDDRGEWVELPSGLFKKKVSKTGSEGEQETEWVDLNLTGQERHDKVFGACKKICEEMAGCMQFMALKESCKVYEAIELGWKAPLSWEDHDLYRSGWMMDIVEELRKKQCGEPEV